MTAGNNRPEPHAAGSPASSGSSSQDRAVQAVSTAKLMEQRYGVRQAQVRPLRLVALAVLAVLAVSWLMWAAWHQANATAHGGMRSFTVVSEHQVDVLIDIRRSDGEAVTCTLKAQAADHTIVGEQDVVVPAGKSGEIEFAATIETDREATTATVAGCR